MKTKEEYLAKARELRDDPNVHYSCAQAVLVTFAEDFGLTAEQAFRIGANLGSGMKIGSVCGVVTGGLIVMGLAGKDSQQEAAAFSKAISDLHEGNLMCSDLLRINAERGGSRKPHCDGMVYETVELLCDRFL